jgi:acyl-coenzyme A thioesterase PaaI-like protein
MMRAHRRGDSESAGLGGRRPKFMPLETSGEGMDAEALKQAGYVPTPNGGFTNHAGPFWLRYSLDGVEAALPIEARHCNEHMGKMHGGLLMTFADIALGAKVGEALNSALMVTTQINVHFVAGANLSEVLTCKPELVRKTSRMVFVRGLIEAGGRTVANVDGIWTVLAPK